MTSLDQHSFTVNSIGKQAQSARKSAALYSLSKVGREARDGVYVSEDHCRTQWLGRQSPKGGFLYDQPGSLGGHSYSFGASSKKQTIKKEDIVPTNDALDIQVDTQTVKYKRAPENIIGTNPRGTLKDATLLQNHSVAFFGRNSPGPAAIGEEFGPNWKGAYPRTSPARPFGIKTKGVDMYKIGDNPLNVGPGTHDRRDVALGKQYLSNRRNQSVNEFSKSAKFPKGRDGDAISVLDAARSCMGKQVLGKNKSEPSINFSYDSRDTRSKTKLCVTVLDTGPKATMPKFHAPMPRLPPEAKIMNHGIG